MSTGPAPRVTPDRWVGICVRTAHLLATSAYVGRPVPPAAAKAASAAALIIGSVGSHQPRSVRTWTLEWPRAAAS